MLTKINEKLYMCRSDGIVFTLKYGDRGTYSIGKAWYLRAYAPNSEHISVATFTVKDDGRECYLEDHGGKLWKDIREILPEANRMIDLMLES